MDRVFDLSIRTSDRPPVLVVRTSGPVLHLRAFEHVRPLGLVLSSCCARELVPLSPISRLVGNYSCEACRRAAGHSIPFVEYDESVIGRLNPSAAGMEILFDHDPLTATLHASLTAGLLAEYFMGTDRFVRSLPYQNSIAFARRDRQVAFMESFIEEWT